MPDVSVSVPARPDFVHVLRSVVAAVAARANFTYDEIDDLRLAVDEACAQLLSFGHGATSLRLDVEVAAGGDALRLTASTDADGAAWPPAGGERTLTWQVLSALADQASFANIDGGPAMQLVKHREAAGAR